MGPGVVPAVPEGVVNHALELRAEAEVVERSAGAQVPADGAGVEVVDRVRAELGLDLAADLVQVDAEGGSQGGWIETRPVTGAGADHEPDRVPGLLGGDAVSSQEPRRL